MLFYILKIMKQSKTNINEQFSLTLPLQTNPLVRAEAAANQLPYTIVCRPLWPGKG